MRISLEQARAAKSEALEAFRRFGEVVGVGITRIGDDYAVKVNFRHAPAQGTRIPTHVQGVPVRVEVTGTIVPRTPI